MAIRRDKEARAPRPAWRGRLRRLILLAVLCASAWMAFVTWFGVWRLDLITDRRIELARAQAADVARVGAQALDRQIDALRTIPRLLAGQERFGRNLATFALQSAMLPRQMWGSVLQQGELLRLDRDLADLADNLSLSGIYVVTETGYIVASSDARTSPTHLGSTFSGRDHFVDAMGLGEGEQFGVDPVSGDPMFFFSHRVRRGGAVVGAVIVAVSSERLLLRVDRGPETVFVNDHNGVVVIASQSENLYRLVRASAVRSMSDDALAMRYGRVAFEPMPIDAMPESTEEVVDVEAVYARAPMAQNRMAVHIVAPLPDLVTARRENVVVVAGLALFGLLLTAVVTIALVQIAAMRERAVRDPLTGLSNRRYADEVVPRLIDLDDRGRLAGFTIAAFDLDRFKQINDTWGHHVGDRVLRRFARILQDSARRSDLVFRLGGEEFVVILVEEDVDAALVYAERVRVATEKIADMAPVPPGRITVSTGVAKRAQGEDFESLVRRADALLYRAKESGRNRVESDEPA